MRSMPRRRQASRSCLSLIHICYWASKEDVVRNRAIDRVFHPEITAEERAAKVKGWSKAVKCSYGWAKDE